MSIPKILAIHDLCGTGRCSLSVAAPVLGVMGLQCCALPTAYFSAPTNTQGYVCHDLSDALTPALRHWSELKLHFAAIYSGYLASKEQINAVLLAGKLFPRAITIIDPVMGDNGKLYRRFDKDFCGEMHSLCQNARIITPNVTEAAILLGKAPSDTPAHMDEALAWTKALGAERRSVVMTGFCSGDNNVASLWWDADSGKAGAVQTAYIPVGHHGTGDIFASVLTGALIKGKPLPEAVSRAANFTHNCVAYSAAQNAPPQDGILLEDLLVSLAAGD